MDKFNFIIKTVHRKTKSKMLNEFMLPLQTPFPKLFVVLM